MENRFADLVKAAGVVSAGGAGFPTHVKLSSKPEYIIMNAAECEPLIRVDHQRYRKSRLPHDNSFSPC